jgi:hypothetical protein
MKRYKLYKWLTHFKKWKCVSQSDNYVQINFIADEYTRQGFKMKIIET